MAASRTFVLAAPGTVAPVVRTYWVVPGLVLGGAYPGAQTPAEHGERVRALLAAGVRTFIDLTEPGEPNNVGIPLAAYETFVTSSGVEARHRRFAIPDGKAPTMAFMREVVDAIDDGVEKGPAAFVHCFGGVGRTATALGCWMRRHGLASSDDFIDKLTTLRRADTVRGNRRAPESEEQFALVRAYRD